MPRCSPTPPLKSSPATRRPALARPGRWCHYWDRLVAGGEESQCGWLKDRFGVSWQVVPRRLHELLSDPQPARATAATKAMLGMRKIVIAELEDAAERA
jgi:hypothetical protein